MGVVYRAYDTRLDRTVALKFLLPQLSLDPSAKMRFHQEARAVATLDHANLCTIHEVGETPHGQHFLAMPLYSGETLKERLAREGALPLTEALDIVRQMAEGLACAHAAGIVHRDMKPGNVMLLPGGKVKILDFGLAKVRELSLTGPGVQLGTLAYMAPEQLEGDAEVGFGADLWALGVVLYQMLTGRLPFGAEHEVATLHLILHAEPLPPSAVRSELPTEVEEVVTTLLQKDPARRYANAEALLQALAVLTPIGESSPRRTRRVAARWVEARRVAGSRPRPFRVGAILALAGLAGLAGVLVLGVRAFVPGEPVAFESNPVLPSAAESEARLSPADQAWLERSGIVNPTAREYVLRAREFLHRFNVRDNDAGLALLRQSRKLEPTYPDVHAALAMAFTMRYWQVGDRGLLDSAVVAGQRAVDLDPAYAEGYSNLGWALNHRGDAEESLQAHLRAVQLSPYHSGGLAALYHWGFGRLDEAARWWDPALEREPTNTMIYWHAGRTYLALGMPARARELLEKAVNFEPSFTWGQYALTLAFLQQAKPELAGAQIHRMLAATRDDPSALIYAGLVSLAIEDRPAARNYLERGLAEAQAFDKVGGLLVLAWILRQSGEVERARELVREAASRFVQFWGGDPTRPEDFVDLARIRVLEGDREDALRLLETGVRRGWRFVNNTYDPILGSLKGEPRYDRLMAEVHADIAQMRTRVEREGW